VLRAEQVATVEVVPRTAKVVKTGVVALALRSAPRVVMARVMVQTAEVAMVGVGCVAPAMKVLAK